MFLNLKFVILLSITNLELLLGFVKSLEESISLPITCNKPLSISVDNGRKYQVRGVISHSFEVVRNTDKSLHFSEILGFDFFKWRTELQLLLPMEKSLE